MLAIDGPSGKSSSFTLIPSLTIHIAGLLSCGVAPQLERHEPYNAVLEAAIGYAGACTVQAMDEIAGVCERMDVVEEKGDAVHDDVIMLDRKVEEAEG